MAVEPVSSFKFVGMHISEDLSWTLNTLQPDQEGPSAPLLLKDTEKGQPLDCHPGQLLPLCNWEYPYQLYHNLVWKLICCWLQGTAESGENRLTHHKYSTAEDVQRSDVHDGHVAFSIIPLIFPILCSSSVILFSHTCIPCTLYTCSTGYTKCIYCPNSSLFLYILLYLHISLIPSVYQCSQTVY